jgi:hypothetical protein
VGKFLSSTHAAFLSTSAEPAQADGVEVEENGGQQATRLGAPEGTPEGVRLSGCGADAGGGEDTADGARTDVVAKPG